MEEIGARKDILFAFFVAVALHIGVASTHISFVRPDVTIREATKRVLDISFVSSFEAVEKTVSAQPVVKTKKPSVVKRMIKRKRVEKQKVAVPEPEEKEEVVHEEVMPVHRELVEVPVVIKDIAPPAGAIQSTEAAVVVTAVPRYKENAPPVYPRLARRRGYEGTVVFSVWVLVDGTVGELEVKQSSGHSTLDRAAERAVRKWKFTPASRMGVPCAMSVDVPVRFVLN